MAINCQEYTLPWGWLPIIEKTLSKIPNQAYQGWLMGANSHGIPWTFCRGKYKKVIVVVTTANGDFRGLHKRMLELVFFNSTMSIIQCLRLRKIASLMK